MVTNKTHDVPDHLCTHCSQLWLGECRAYEAPHTNDERLKRRESRPLCEVGGGTCSKGLIERIRQADKEIKIGGGVR